MLTDWALGDWRQNKYARQTKVGLVIDTDGWYGGQCKDFVNAYLDRFTGWIPPGNATDIASCVLPPTVERIPYKPGVGLQPGDVFVENRGPNGHTGVITQVIPGGWMSVDQNWYNPSDTYGSPPAIVHHTTALLRCVLRIIPGKGGNGMANQETVWVNQLLNAAGVGPKGSPAQADVNEAIRLIDKKNKDYEGQKAAADVRKAFVDGVISRIGAALGQNTPNDIDTANRLVEELIQGYISHRRAAEIRYSREVELAKRIGAPNLDKPEDLQKVVDVLDSKGSTADQIIVGKLTNAKNLAKQIVDIP